MIGCEHPPVIWSARASLPYSTLLDEGAVLVQDGERQERRV
jgi:hypothetical protein